MRTLSGQLPACARAVDGRRAGLVCFEAAELAWIGFQPLEAVFALVGVTIVGLACCMPSAQP